MTGHEFLGWAVIIGLFSFLAICLVLYRRDVAKLPPPTKEVRYDPKDTCDRRLREAIEAARPKDWMDGPLGTLVALIFAIVALIVVSFIFAWFGGSRYYDPEGRDRGSESHTGW